MGIWKHFTIELVVVRACQAGVRWILSRQIKENQIIIWIDQDNVSFPSLFLEWMKNGAVLDYENCYNIDKVMSCRNTRFRSWKSVFCIWSLLYMYYSKRFWLENERRQRIDTLISFRKCKYSLSLKLKQHLKVVSKHELVSAPNLFNRRQIDISIKSAFADDTFNINLA